MEYRLVFPNGEIRTILNVAALQLALAALVQPGSADQADPGDRGSNARRTSITRQQSGESGSDEDGNLGTAELRRDDGLLFQPGIPGELSAKEVLPLPKTDAAVAQKGKK